MRGSYQSIPATSSASPTGVSESTYLSLPRHSLLLSPSAEAERRRAEGIGWPNAEEEHAGIWSSLIRLMDPSGLGLGGLKAGAPTDPLAFIKRPTVVIRICSLLFSIIVLGCITSQGWQYHQDTGTEVCIMNGSATACNFGNTLAVVAFLACIGLLVAEYFYDQMSSIKSRKHFLWADIGFSGVWAFFFLVSFCLMTHQWASSEEPPAGYGHMNMNAAIFFSFLSIFTWAASGFLSYQRLQAGFEAAFGGGVDEQQAGYQAYQQTGYSEPPFSRQGEGGEYDRVQY